MKAFSWLWTWLQRLAHFVFRVVGAFLNNRGLLLAGGVGYNALLSLVPFILLTVQALSLFFERGEILAILGPELKVVVPENAEAILEGVDSFLQNKAAASVVSVVSLLFFSSVAFRMLEQAIAAIFHTSGKGAHRHFWVSAILPYTFMLLLMGALFFLTLLTSSLDALWAAPAWAEKLPFSIEGGTTLLLRLAGSLGLVALFAAIYRVLPVIKISMKRALIGGICAAILWELVGRFMIYYFSSLSMVNVIYGSLATTVVMLLFMEIAFIILLLGGQVIAVLEANAAAKVPWWTSGSSVEERTMQPLDFDPLGRS